MEKSRFFTKRTLAASVASVSMLALLACGKTNPVEDYPEFETWGEKTNQQPRTQTYAPSDLYTIKTEDDALLNFVEGETRSYYIKPRLLVNGVEYSLSATNLPEGASFTKSNEPGHEGDYVLSWTPAIGTLDPREPNGRSAKFQIVTNVHRTSDQKAAEIMQQIGHDREMTILLVRTNEQPLVENVDLGGEAVTQGEVKTFSVVVKDLGAGKGVPAVYGSAEEDMSQENAKVDGLAYVRVSKNPEKLGDARFRFKVQLDTSSVTFPKNKNSVLVRVVLVVKSPSLNWSPERVVEVRVNRKATAQDAAATNASNAGSQGDKK